MVSSVCSKKEVCDCKKPKHHKHDCCPKRDVHDCLPKKVIFDCTNIPGATNITPSVLAEDLVGDTKTVGSISVDLSCFKRPCVKLDFFASLLMPLIGVGTSVTFTVYRQCDNTPRIEVGSFTVTDEFTIAGTTPVNFTVCDCPQCPASCCTYSVEVAADSLLDELNNLFTFNVVNGVLSVTAADKC